MWGDVVHSGGVGSHSLGGGSALQSSVGSEGPVFPIAGPKCALLCVLADLHLECFLVALLILIG